MSWRDNALISFFNDDIIEDLKNQGKEVDGRKSFSWIHNEFKFVPYPIFGIKYCWVFTEKKIDFNRNIYLVIIACTHCVLRVNAAEVMDEGRLRPLMISCHCFLLMTSTRPPREVTRLYNSYKSKTCLAMMGKRLIGVPGKERERREIWVQKNRGFEHQIN